MAIPCLSSIIKKGHTPHAVFSPFACLVPVSSNNFHGSSTNQYIFDIQSKSKVVILACRQQQLALLVFAGTRWSHMHTGAVGDKTLRVWASPEPMKRWGDNKEVLISERAHIDPYNIEVVSYQHMFHRSACIMLHVLH